MLENFTKTRSISFSEQEKKQSDLCDAVPPVIVIAAGKVPLMSARQQGLQAVSIVKVSVGH